MVSIVKEGTCCSCCALMIANNDESGCRDFYGHDHPSPYEGKWFLTEVVGTNDHIVITDTEDQVIVGPCTLCGQGESGYMQGHTFAVLSDQPNDDDQGSESLGSCGCTDYHMADCPTRTGNYERDPMDDYDPYDY